MRSARSDPKRARAARSFLPYVFMTAVGMKDIKFDDFTKQEHVQEGDFIDDKDMPVYTCMRKLIKRISKYR